MTRFVRPEPLLALAGLGLVSAFVAPLLARTGETSAELRQAASPTPDQTPVETSPWRPLTSPVTVELRGLSVAGDRVAWASGAKGTVLRTTDGETFRVVPVPGASGLDFRDIEAFDENVAIAMSIGPGPASNVFKTTDGGATWRKTFTNPEAGELGFWDAISFWDAKRGVMFGDPVRGRFQVYTTSDGGESWKLIADAGMPEALANEGGFAASGQCLAVGPEGRVAFVTGGAATSRVFVSSDFGKTFQVSVSPVVAGAASKGLFAAHWIDAKTLLVVGGDYRERALAGTNAAVSSDEGASWKAIQAQPVGFLSSLARSGGDGSVVAVGLAGTGLTKDGGRSWTALGKTPYNTAAFTKDGASGWAVGPKGAIGRFVR